MRKWEGGEGEKMVDRGRVRMEYMEGRRGRGKGVGRGNT